MSDSPWPVGRVSGGAKVKTVVEAMSGEFTVEVPTCSPEAVSVSELKTADLLTETLTEETICSLASDAMSRDSRGQLSFRVSRNRWLYQ